MSPKFYKGYKVFPDGRIFGKRGKYLTPHLNDKGYWCVGLSLDGKSTLERVHRILAKLFIPNPENKPCVNHIDADRANNDLSNLEWATYSENVIHSVKLGARRSKAFRESHSAPGEKNGNAKLKQEQVDAMRDLYSMGYSQNKLERIFGVNQGRIHKILNYKQWPKGKELELKTNKE